MGDEKCGVYRKYEVRRLNDPAGKHDACDYYVLDWKHDPFAIPAALAYANACEAQFPQLASDLREQARLTAERRALDDQIVARRSP